MRISQGHVMILLLVVLIGLIIGAFWPSEKADASNEVCFTPNVRNHPTNPFFCGEPQWNMKSK